MHRQLAIVCVWAMLAASLLAGQKPVSPLRSKIEAEFANKEFRTKIMFGNSFSSRAQNGQIVNQLVDTELSPGGIVRYYARFGCCPAVAGTYIREDAITSKLPVGSRVGVKKIDFMNDRIELQLAGSANNAYAKLKVMLGKGYEQRTDFNAILRLISMALRIERLEEQQRLQSEFEAFKGRVAADEADVQRYASDPDKRVEAMQDLKHVLEQLIENRSAYGHLIGESIDTTQYSSQVAELDKAITELKDSISKQRIEMIRDKLKADEQQAELLKARLQTKPASLKEWETLIDSLKQWEESISRRQDLQHQLTDAGVPPLPAEVAALEKDSRDTQNTRKTLEGMEKEIQLIELNNEYIQMEPVRVRLLDSYTRAYGTPDQKAAATRLLDHLQRMYKNRTSAANLGSPEAATQAERLLKEIDRIKRQYSGEHTDLRSAMSRIFSRKLLAAYPLSPASFQIRVVPPYFE
jgi:hypothetical protein